MNDNQIMAKITEIFSDILDREVKITLDSKPENVEGWDSLNHINILMAVQSDFEIQFSLEEMQQIKKVQDLFDIIMKKVA